MVGGGGEQATQRCPMLRLSAGAGPRDCEAVCSFPNAQVPGPYSKSHPGLVPSRSPVCGREERERRHTHQNAAVYEVDLEEGQENHSENAKSCPPRTEMTSSQSTPVCDVLLAHCHWSLGNRFFCGNHHILALGQVNQLI